MMIRSDSKRRSLVAVFGILAAACGCASESARSETKAASETGAAMTTAAPEVPVTSEAAIGSIAPAELLAALNADDPPVVLDVRSAAEYEAGHVPGAINVPYDEVAERLDSLAAFSDRDLVVYCRTGRRAGIAERVLQDAGFERLWDLEGHMVAWQANGLPLAGTCC